MRKPRVSQIATLTACLTLPTDPPLKPWSKATPEVESKLTLEGLEALLTHSFRARDDVRLTIKDVEHGHRVGIPFKGPNCFGKHCQNLLETLFR